jgi:hypothetical protein
VRTISAVERQIHAKGGQKEINEVARACKTKLRPAACYISYFEVLQLSEIFVTFETVKEGCEELLALLGLVELVELLGLELDAEDEDDALCVPVTRTCWLTCLLRSSFAPLS